MKSFSIKNRKISVKHKPYIIAEISANHNGNINNAFELIRQAKLCGADAIKLQTYTADTLTIDSKKEDFLIKEGLWAGKTLYELYQWAHTPWEWHKQLFDYAADIGITLFSSPFDNTAIDYLEKLNCPAYKIASFEAVDLELIKYASSTGKPIIISTGMANQRDIQQALEAALSSNTQDVSLLHCVSSYPAKPSDYNINTIKDMHSRYKVVIGLSDHTINNITAIASIPLGAALIEKHFTLDRNGGGPDDSFSLEPDDMKRLVSDANEAWESLGIASYDLKKSEKENMKFRRSLYFVEDIKQGEKVSNQNVKSIRPGYGIAPKYLSEIIGCTLTQDVEKGTPVNWQLLSLN